MNRVIDCHYDLKSNRFTKLAHCEEWCLQCFLYIPESFLPSVFNQGSVWAPLNSGIHSTEIFYCFEVNELWKEGQGMVPMGNWIQWQLETSEWESRILIKGEEWIEQTNHTENDCIRMESQPDKPYRTLRDKL